MIKKYDTTEGLDVLVIVIFIDNLKHIQNKNIDSNKFKFNKLFTDYSSLVNWSGDYQLISISLSKILNYYFAPVLSKVNAQVEHRRTYFAQ